MAQQSTIESHIKGSNPNINNFTICHFDRPNNCDRFELQGANTGLKHPGI